MFYGGFLFNYGRSVSDGEWYSSQSIVLKAGRLFDIAKNIYLDLGLPYSTNIGKARSSIYGSFDQDYSILAAQVGVEIFFK